MFSTKFVRRVFPAVNWLPEYTVQKGICDLIAGITVGLTLIPQSIAYAALAGLGPQYGLYSSLVGGIVYMIFGTVAELNIAPTAIISLLTYSYISDFSYGPVSGAILLCFLSGVVAIICGVFHLGFLVDFVSTPVVAGFTSAGALTIAASQIKNLLGLHFQAESFLKTIYNVFLDIRDTQLWDTVLSVGCCTFLIGFREIKRYGKPPSFDKSSEENHSSWKTVLWFLSVARNAVLVISCAIMAYVFQCYELSPFSLTGLVPEGLPHFYRPLAVNGTANWDFLDATKELGTGIFVVPFIAILSNIAIAKAFSNGKVLDASQEMLAVGLCNLCGSFFGSYPVNASFSRAAVNNASGARTTFGGIYATILVILSLTFLTPYFSYIPKATLSSVILCAVIYMVEMNLSKIIWKINKIDFFSLAITLIACLALSIEIGIIIGILVDLLFVLYFTARPKIEIERIKHAGDFVYLQITLVGYLFYSAAEYARQKVMKEFQGTDTYPKYVIFDCNKLRKLDFTSAKCLDSLVDDLSKLGTKVAFVSAKPSLETLLGKTLKHKCSFLQTTDDIESFFQEKEFWNGNLVNCNAVVNTAYEPDGGEMVQMK